VFFLRKWLSILVAILCLNLCFGTLAETAAPNDFYVSEITDEIFTRIWEKSFKTDCTVPREDLRYLHVLHVDLAGETHEGEIIVNRHIADTVLDIFRQLYEAGYPIEKIRLVDEYDADDETSMRDNNSSSFNFRFISHTTKVSKHGLGLAIDINTLYNPYTKVVDGERIIEPATGEPYLDRAADFPYKIDHDDLAYKLFTEAGFEWGGDWTDRKDYQHFEIPTNIIALWYPESANLGEPSPMPDNIYMVLVNKTHPLPPDWDQHIVLDTALNAWNHEIQIEHETFEAYKLLEAACREKGVIIHLDSVYRSVDAQKELWLRFEQEYGFKYTQGTVATPTLSEHHTGLAVDVCLEKDGVLIDENEDMMKETELFGIVHQLLPKYGFILRYPEGKKDITGYNPECWHFRYIGDPAIAQEITDKGITLEEYLGTTD
jgi:LAS superfamily LD-carboxypeptidase LdcB